MSAFTELLDAILRTKATTETATSLLIESRRLPSLHLVADEAHFPSVRVVYRIKEGDDMGFGTIDLYRKNRFEGDLDTFRIAICERKWGYTALNAEKFLDFVWNFQWVFLNIEDYRVIPEPALRRILEAVDLDTNDETVGED